MNSLVALVLLGQIIGCTFSHHLSTQLDCNAVESQKLADLAVHYINEHSLHGYKHVLNVIKDVHVLPRRPTGKVFYLQVELLETVCHVLDETPIKNCTVREQRFHAVEGDCDVKILSDEGVDKVVAVKCHSSPDSVEDVKRNCPNCPTLLRLNDPHVVECVDYVLHKHNEKNPNHAYEVLEISRGQHKHEPEAFYVEFAIVETNCTHEEVHDEHHHCHAKEDGNTGFCRATVFRSHAAVDKPKDEQFESDCIIHAAKAGASHTHLIEHHLGKHIASPGHNNTVLDLVHSHNHTSASHETHSHEHPHVPVVKREAPTAAPNHHTHAVNLCPGKLIHFKV